MTRYSLYVHLALNFCLHLNVLFVLTRLARSLRIYNGDITASTRSSRRYYGALIGQHCPHRRFFLVPRSIPAKVEEHSSPRYYGKRCGTQIATASCFISCAKQIRNGCRTKIDIRCRMSSLQGYDNGKDTKESSAESILNTYKLTKNLFKLSDEQHAGRTIMEVYANKKINLGVFMGLCWDRKDSDNKCDNVDRKRHHAQTTPRIEVNLFRPIQDFEEEQTSHAMERTLIDIGQITTIWFGMAEEFDKIVSENIKRGDEDNSHFINKLKLLCQYMEDAQHFVARNFPVNYSEIKMEELYQSYKGRGRGSNRQIILTKKDIVNLSGSDSHLQEVLCKAILSPRIVTSQDAAMQLFATDSKTPASSFAMHSRLHNGIARTIVGAISISEDAKFGGRFKRVPCTFVADKFGINGKKRDIFLLNGGWLAVDNSMKSAAEGRKFASRTHSTTTQVSSLHSADQAPGSDKEMHSEESDGNAMLLTNADERIAYRLECLAMGEQTSCSEESNDDRQLEVDAREALFAMDLPLTPEGARDALIRVGRWSSSSSSSGRPLVEPWSKHVLFAASDLSAYCAQVRQTLAALSYPQSGERISTIKGRCDLRSLPCVCIDGKSARFRDDAIGVRSRSTTGRAIVDGASKWEILVHVTDVSDIYSPSPESCVKGTNLSSKARDLLNHAAATRGISRYDLPRGPLHLLPPAAVNGLALADKKLFQVNGGPLHETIHLPRNAANRCVTLWAYIDERSGRLLDVGVERTLISAPLSLSFEGATILLERSSTSDTNSSMFENTKAILAVAERNLLLWSKHRQTISDAARKREERLATRELVARETFSYSRIGTLSHFDRNRGARIVDSALDLYGFGVASLLKKAGASVPRASGSGADRGGRVGTAPLRRYIDGVAQRQILSSLCGYGGRPLSHDECTEANRIAAKAYDAKENFGIDRERGTDRFGSLKNKRTLRNLAGHLAKFHNGKKKFVPALSTGRENEVAISGVGALAKCDGVKGSLTPGQRIMVEVVKLDAEKGILKLSFAGPQ